ncbi:HAD family phosphatase [Streptomyces sp. VRA16 Mangrove soil]|uniref:HAD family hydrolase n=1 Tax=Streptomyces sp. VRA16 Mangrove soil TaxID=2817434 RepID=UPI001A9E84F9|nr:HAD family phosphatase [Streptomyces sp. VRA16 Mangrove soil]MBO1334257.1 HAD family phosphatase [Streptomyces sp. VRA16 Mangrove soil]
MNEPVRGIVCDYGGVLTNPLQETFAAFADTVGVPLPQLQRAFAAATAADGRSPMADLETGRCTEEEMVLRVLRELPGAPGLELLGGRPFGELWFRARLVNEELVGHLRRWHAAGCTLALLTNNVREWRPRWRAGLPVDELFHTVVDSSEEGVRKPDAEIYRRLADRLPVPLTQCLFVDDLADNRTAAEAHGMTAVPFTSTADAVRRIDALLRERGVHQPRSAA